MARKYGRVGYKNHLRRRRAGRTGVPALIVLTAALWSLVFLDVDLRTLHPVLDPGRLAVSPGDTGPPSSGTATTILRGGHAWNGAAGERRYTGGGQIGGRVSHVRDGDTLEVGGQAIRLANLDCAERGTADGERAAKRMRRLARGRMVHCALTGETSYDRLVGSCILTDGRDLGDILVAERLCTYRQ